ncbi:unnamed protein product [Colias eurytheme]|nr:unnamed protein product [Colias eurytheme]
MDNIRLFLLRIILTSIIISILIARETQAYSTIPSNSRHSDVSNYNTGTQRRNWSKSQLSNLPPYLVLNRKTGSYFPYYKFPYENSLRRKTVQTAPRWGNGI